MKVYIKEWKETPYGKHDYETVSIHTDIDILRSMVLMAGYKRPTDIEANEIYEKNDCFGERIRIREMEVR